MNRLLAPLGGIIIIAVFFVGCPGTSAPVEELKHYPLDNLAGVIAKSNVSLDDQVFSQGSSSLRIVADKPATVRLYETGDLDVEDARLTFRAKVKTRDVVGKVYLEMLCGFPGKGDFFSRGLQSPLTGTSDWAFLETPFFLKVGENPDNIKLNIVIDGRGTVWIDDIRLLSGPLK